MIARAAEGSARDGLSILDQAIAHGAGAVTADQVRDMLGLADRGRIRRLLQLVLAGDAAAALAELDEAHELGIDPTQLLRGLMESLHAATRAKAGASADALQSRRGARERAERWRSSCRWGTIHRLWQMLLKGLQDVEIAPDPREAAEMALLRLIHAADMPDPAALLAKLSGEGAAPRRRAAPAGKASRRRRRSFPADFPALVKLLEAERQASARAAASRSGRAGPLRAARAGAEADAAARRRLAARPRGGAEGGDRRAAGRCRCPTKPASRRCSTRRKWPRSAFAPKCWPIPTSAR